MSKLLKSIYELIAFNFKTLISFEVIYRFVGIFIIFPLGRLLFYAAIELSGFEYVTNQLFLEFLFSFETMAMVFIFMVILSLYIVIEMVFLAIIFDFSYQKKAITLKELIIAGSLRTLHVLKKYHILVIIPAGLFFILVETIHLAGIASTVNIPAYWLEQLNTLPNIRLVGFFVFLIMIVIFIETVFTLNYYSVETLSFKEAYTQSRMMLRKQRFWMIFEFFFVNLILNIFFYLIYALILVVIGGIIFISRGQEFVLGFLLTITYSLYTMIGLLATSILFPINYALMSVWYNTFKNQRQLTIKRNISLKSSSRKDKKRTYRYGLYVGIIVLFIINITNIYTIIYQEDVFNILNPPEVIAHRGASIDSPENTMAAFDEALYQGSDALEIDIRFTKDGIPVVIHDRTLQRTSGGAYSDEVSNLTFEEIQTIDVGSWFDASFTDERIPSLEEVLIEYGTKTNFLIELKDYDEESEMIVVSLIQEYTNVDNVIIMSFNQLQLIRIKDLDDQIETMFLMSTFYGNFTALINKDYIDHFALEANLILNNKGYVERIQSLGKKVYVWTVNDEEIMEELAQLYVNGIITDRPLLTREIVYGEPTRSLISIIINEFFSPNND